MNKFIICVLCLFVSQSYGVNNEFYKCQDSDAPANYALFTFDSQTKEVTDLVINAYGTIGRGKFASMTLHIPCNRQFCRYSKYMYAKGHISMSEMKGSFMLGRNFVYSGSCEKI